MAATLWRQADGSVLWNGADCVYYQEDDACAEHCEAPPITTCNELEDCFGVPHGSAHGTASPVEMEITLPVVIDDICSDCESVAGTYILDSFVKVNDSSGPCYFQAQLDSQAWCSGSGQVIVRAGNTTVSGWLMQIAIGGAVSWAFTAVDAQEILGLLCAGEIVELEVFSNSGNPCDITGTTATIQLL